MKKVLFCDVDGTLMIHHPNGNIIPEGVKEELKRLKELGYDLFIASGRPTGFISYQLREAGFNGYVLCNGAHVELNGKNIYEHPIPYEEVVSLVEFLESVNCSYAFETAADCYVEKKFESFYNFFIHCDINKEQLLTEFDKDEVMHRTLKVEIYTENGKEIENYIKDKFSYDNHGTQNAFEVYPKEVSKATGIKKVIEYLNIPIENCYAVGDDLNDVEMIQFVGHGIAMGNACQELKDVADEVIGHVENNGLANYLKTLN